MEKQPAKVANATKEFLQIMLDSKLIVKFLEKLYTYTQNYSCRASLQNVTKILLKVCLLWKCDGYYKVWQKKFCYKCLCPVLQSDVCYNVWQNFITSASGISSCVRYYMWQNFFTNCFSYDSILIIVKYWW